CHHARLHQAAVYGGVRQRAAGRLRHLDEHRHLHHEEDDQLQVLSDMNIGYLHLLLEREFLVTAFSAIAAFATIVTLFLPYLAGKQLEGRMKAVAQRREELRQKQREALNQAGRRGQLRSTPVGFMKQTLDKLKLEKLLESPGMKEKLARAGWRGQGPMVT